MHTFPCTRRVVSVLCPLSSAWTSSSTILRVANGNRTESSILRSYFLVYFVFWDVPGERSRFQLYVVSLSWSKSGFVQCTNMNGRSGYFRGVIVYGPRRPRITWAPRVGCRDLPYRGSVSQRSGCRIPVKSAVLGIPVGRGESVL